MMKTIRLALPFLLLFHFPLLCADLIMHDITRGSGEVVTDGRVAIVEYELFVSKKKKFKWAAIVEVGSGSEIPALDRGLVGMAIGGKRKLTVPPEWGYAGSEVKGLIPRNTAFDLVVELMELP